MYFIRLRIVNVWNSLTDESDLVQLKVTRSIKRVSFNDFVSYS